MAMGEHGNKWEDKTTLGLDYGEDLSVPDKKC